MFLIPQQIIPEFIKDQMVVLRGAPGVGKTTLAREYGLTQEHAYTIRFVESAKFEFELDKLAEELDMERKNAENSEHFARDFKLKLNQLCHQNEFKLLFIFDNCKENDPCLEEIMSNFDRAHIKILITTQATSLHRNFVNQYCDVKLFDRDKCMELIQKRKLSQILTEQKWSGVFELIGLRAKGGVLPMDLDDLLTKIETHSSWSVNYLENINSYLNRVDKLDLLKAECILGYQMLIYLSFLDADSDISYRLVKSIFDKPDNDLEAAFKHLVDNHFLSLNAETRFYKILECVQKKARDCLEYGLSNVIIDDLVATLLNLIPNIHRYEKNVADLDCEIENYYFHALALLGRKIRLESESEALLCAKLGLINELYMLKYDESLIYYQKALNIHKCLSTTASIDTANVLDNLGELSLKRGEYKQAGEHFEASLAIREKLLPHQNDANKAKTINNIGVVYENEENLDAALKHYKSALDMYRITLPANHPDIAEALLNIANVHETKQDYESALKTYDEAICIYKQTLDADHQDIAIVIRNIGFAYNSQGAYDTALNKYEEALHMLRVTLQPYHPEIANTLNNIAAAYDNRGDFDLAIAKYDEALAIYRKMLHANHLFIANTLDNKGLVYNKQKKFDLARICFKESLVILQQTLPSDHPKIVDLLNDIKKLGLSSD